MLASSVISFVYHSTLILVPLCTIGCPSRAHGFISRFFAWSALLIVLFTCVLFLCFVCLRPLCQYLWIVHLAFSNVYWQIKTHFRLTRETFQTIYASISPLGEFSRLKDPTPNVEKELLMFLWYIVNLEFSYYGGLIWHI